MSSPPLDLDSLTFRRGAIMAVACVAAVFAGAMLTEQPYLIFAGLIGLAYVATLTVNCRALAWAIIALQPAALIVPFFPGRPFWWELCALLAWPSLLAYALVNRRRVELMQLDRLERWALAALGGYLAVLLALMAYRGVGFRAFGGQQMGGRVYAQQLVLGILPLLMTIVKLSRRQLWTAAVAGWLFSLTYLVSEFSFSAGGGVMQSLLYFFELPTDGLNFEASYAITGLRRYGSLATVASAGLACLWTLAPLRELLGRKLWVAGPAMAGLFAAGLGSGYRNMLIVPLATLFFLAIFQRFWTPLRGVAAGVLAAVVFGGLYATVDHLPLSVQRSVSFLPGIDVSPLARTDAAATNLDRLEVMKLAMNDVPKYWLTGRGFGMDRLDQAPLDAASGGVQLLYSQGMFYNGVIGSLLKTGVPGLIFSLLFIWFISRIALRLVRLVRRRPTSDQGLFDRLCLLLCAQWFATSVCFYLTNGDVNWWMQYFGLSAGLIIACHRLQAEAATQENEEVEQRTEGVPAT